MECEHEDIINIDSDVEIEPATPPYMWNQDLVTISSDEECYDDDSGHNLIYEYGHGIGNNTANDQANNMDNEHENVEPNMANDPANNMNNEHEEQNMANETDNNRDNEYDNMEQDTAYHSDNASRTLLEDRRRVRPGGRRE